MNVARRHAVQTGLATGLATGMAAWAGCDGLVSELGRRLGEAVPASLSAAAGRTIDPDFHLLSRATYGPRPGDLARLRRRGPEAWLEEQLHPERIDDTACDLRADRFESLAFAPSYCQELCSGGQNQAAFCRTPSVNTLPSRTRTIW